MIWKQADQGYQDLPDPTEYWYKKDSEEKLHAKLMDQGVSVPEILNESMRDCSENACSFVSICTCLINSQSCT